MPRNRSETISWLSLGRTTPSDDPMAGSAGRIVSIDSAIRAVSTAIRATNSRKAAGDVRSSGRGGEPSATLTREFYAERCAWLAAATRRSDVARRLPGVRRPDGGAHRPDGAVDRHDSSGAAGHRVVARRRTAQRQPADRLAPVSRHRDRAVLLRTGVRQRWPEAGGVCRPGPLYERVRAV